MLLVGSGRANHTRRYEIGLLRTRLLKLEQEERQLWPVENAARDLSFLPVLLAYLWRLASQALRIVRIQRTRKALEALGAPQAASALLRAPEVDVRPLASIPGAQRVRRGH